jgi:hypothetical protein
VCFFIVKETGERLPNGHIRDKSKKSWCAQLGDYNVNVLYISENYRKGVSSLKEMIKV